MSLKNAIRKIAAPRLTMKQALEIFGLDPDSADDLDEKNLKKIYHKLIAKHHIDVIKGKIEASGRKMTQEEEEEATKYCQDIILAYKVLIGEEQAAGPRQRAPGFDSNLRKYHEAKEEAVREEHRRYMEDYERRQREKEKAQKEHHERQLKEVEEARRKRQEQTGIYEPAPSTNLQDLLPHLFQPINRKP